MSVVITGGGGYLAKSIRVELESSFDVYSPVKEELDVRCEISVQSYFSQLDHIDLLVCNAGLVADDLLLKMDLNGWDEVMQVNLRGAFLCAQQAVKKMLKAKSGHIVFIGSHSAFSPPIGQCNYAAAKAGLIGLTKSLAKELGRKNIRVNLVVPGWMESKMTSGVEPQRVDEVRELHALGKFNNPEAVASFIAVLHQQMVGTSGQVFHLDSRVNS